MSGNPTSRRRGPETRHGSLSTATLLCLSTVVTIMMVGPGGDGSSVRRYGSFAAFLRQKYFEDSYDPTDFGKPRARDSGSSATRNVYETDEKASPRGKK
ncbi:Hypothetical protein CINCED_3A008530 [Cinara cedri]|uniref:Uncharacterized protein n=1 Tax=Cinara cedri TaxID=506608 RepID=A0A5E4NAI2_9HEMI|nr:Hypothetical protein CINCED_3A008530 [Cinara cedri]